MAALIGHELDHPKTQQTQLQEYFTKIQSYGLIDGIFLPQLGPTHLIGSTRALGFQSAAPTCATQAI